MGAYLQRANTSPSSQRIFTVSSWVKLASEGGDKYLWSARVDDSNWISCRFATNGTVIIQVYDSNSTVGLLQTNRKLTDFTAWYHIHVIVNTTDGTANDRLRLYINGLQETEFSSRTNPPQNYDTAITGNFQVATSPFAAQYSSNSLDGYLAQFIYADGQAHLPSVIGTLNSDNVWVPNSTPSVTYGNNGFLLEFRDAGASAAAGNFGADTSGNNNHFATTNIVTNPNMKDGPANNFCTIMAQDRQSSNLFSIDEGMLKATQASSANTNNNYGRVRGTMYPTAGKWYMEIKYVSGYSATDGTVSLGIMTANAGRSSTYNYGFNNNQGNGSSTVGYQNNGRVTFNAAEQTTGLTTFTTGDIIGIAMDLDNNSLFISKNGTFFSNGTGTQNPASNTNPIYTGTGISDYKKFGFAPGINLYSNPNGVAQMNYGAPTFTISSGNADGNGYGNFEYAVPSGFYALCTKNLGQYGG